MKKRSIIAIILALCLILSLCACGEVSVKDNTNNNISTNNNANNNTDTPSTSHDPIKLRLLYANKNEKDANVVRDMLTKKGFEVEMIAQADNAGVQTQAEAGNYDVIVINAANATFSVDYALKNYVYTGGSLNWTKISDEALDKMIEEAGAVPKTQWDETYSAIEEYMIDDMAYMAPMYQDTLGIATSKEVDINTIIDTNSYLPFLDYVDTSKRETKPLIYSSVDSSAMFPTLDPIRKTNGVSNLMVNWCYACLVRLDHVNGNTYITDTSLSQAYSVAESSQQFYFLLRDDCYFTRIDKNGEPYVTDKLVAGEDVVYTLLRAANKNSVVGNAISKNFTSLDGVSIVTDLNELKTTKNADGVSIYDELNAGANNTLTGLAATRDDVDGKNGVYQVVRIDTKMPFQQLLNYLCAGNAGIVDSEWVESINSKVDMANYNADKDWLYGDTSRLYPDSNYYNDASFSGAYVVTFADDYGVTLKKNPGFAVNGTVEKDQAKIGTVIYTYAENEAAGFTALRSGEVDLVRNVAKSNFAQAESDSSINFRIIEGSGVHFLVFNRSEDSVCSNLLVRKAICAAINQENVLAAIGSGIPANSVINAGFKTSREIVYDDTATAKYLEEYWNSKN